MKTGNILADAISPAAGERFDELLRHKNLVIERIISSSAPIPTEYVQTQDEWVLLVQGKASLVVSGESVRLAAGDYIFLPAGVPHTVASAAEGSIWLAIHLHAEKS
jgi:cupin 2 domain-containing protein